MDEKERTEAMIRTKQENREMCARCACGGRWKSRNCSVCIRNGWFIDHFREKE